MLLGDSPSEALGSAFRPVWLQASTQGRALHLAVRWLPRPEPHAGLDTSELSKGKILKYLCEICGLGLNVKFTMSSEVTRSPACLPQVGWEGEGAGACWSCTRKTLPDFCPKEKTSVIPNCVER